MSIQNYQNHMRKAPMPFYIGALLGLLSFILSLVACIKSSCDVQGCSRMPYVIAVLLSVSAIIAIAMGRSFALKAQDRAIRAEENLRYFVLTGKLLNPSLTVSQIIALRFASDEELVSLAERALKEKLSNQQIKQAIIHWRADEYRV